MLHLNLSLIALLTEVEEVNHVHECHVYSKPDKTGFGFSDDCSIVDYGVSLLLFPGEEKYCSQIKWDHGDSKNNSTNVSDKDLDILDIAPRYMHRYQNQEGNGAREVEPKA